MRYIKVLLLVILFFLVMMFFVQNQSAFSQAVALKLDLLFLPPVESAPLPFYTLLIICFVLGALCILAMLMWDRVSLSAKLTMANMRAAALKRTSPRPSRPTRPFRRSLTPPKPRPPSSPKMSKTRKSPLQRSPNRRNP